MASGFCMFSAMCCCSSSGVSRVRSRIGAKAKPRSTLAAARDEGQLIARSQGVDRRIAVGEQRVGARRGDGAEDGQADGGGHLLRDVHDARAEAGVVLGDFGHADLQQRHERRTAAHSEKEEGEADGREVARTLAGGRKEEQAGGGGEHGRVHHLLAVAVDQPRRRPADMTAVPMVAGMKARPVLTGE